MDLGYAHEAFKSGWRVPRRAQSGTYLEVGKEALTGCGAHGSLDDMAKRAGVGRELGMVISPRVMHFSRRSIAPR
jgi:hypothetical protein